jgi:hypothetical protein
MRLVSVVIPMFNAERTIERTLQSVRRQSHSELEVLVVDDGSTDQSAAIVDAFCTLDSRFKRLSKENGGVASARNLGIRHARADYIAVIDADDLWHPQFVEKTLRALLAGGEEFSFAYALNRRIDENDRVIGSAPRYDCEGRVVCQHAYVNFVGNGSAMLMRKVCVLECGGYDETLHARGSQGCEDWLMQMRLAENHQVAQVPEYLVGYRQISGQMSENCDAMSSSLEIALEAMKQRCPDLPCPAIRWTRARIESGRLFDALRRRSLTGVLRSLLAAIVYDPRVTLFVSMPKFLMHLLHAVKSRIINPNWSGELIDTRKTFQEMAPLQDVSLPEAGIQTRRLLWLRELDGALAAQMLLHSDCRGGNRETVF